jgi:hypothetical protein
VKRFVSFQCLILRQSVCLLGRKISPTQGRYLHRTTQTQTNIHALNGIRIHEQAKTARPLWSAYQQYCNMIWISRNSIRYNIKTSEPYRPSDRRLSAKLVPTFADRGCRVVSATDPHGRILGFLDPKLLLFHSSSSSVIFTRLSGLRSRPTTSQKIW